MIERDFFIGGTPCCLEKEGLGFFNLGLPVVTLFLEPFSRAVRDPNGIFFDIDYELIKHLCFYSYGRNIIS